MTSEIRANTLKNRVGLGTVSYTNTGIVVSGIVTANSFSGPFTGDITGDGDLTLTSTDSGAAAAPTIRLQRDSSSPANQDVLGQVLFGGKDSNIADENYASVAGKIIQAGGGGEHGAIQITTRKASANVITANLTSTDYELLNGTNLSVDGNITGNGNFQLTSTDTGSSAAPELTLHRNSASPADADYLGQIKFAGKHDGGSTVNYAKITGKILDASNGTEDGIIEFAHIKAGTQTITGRWRSDSLQLLNGTSLTVAGTTTLSDDLNVDSGTLFVDVSSNRIGINQGVPSKALDVVGSGEFSSALTVGATLTVSGTCTLGQTVSINGTNPQLQFVDTNHDSDYSIYGSNGRFSVYDATNSAERFRINSTGKITHTYDGTAYDAQYGQFEIAKEGASNADPDWSYLSLHRRGQIGWQLGIDSNHFVIASTGGAAKNTLDAEKLRIESGGGLKFTGQGTSIPVGGILHHTNNNLYVRGGTNGLILGNQDNTNTIQIYNGYIKFETNDGSEKLRITSGGSVNIGGDYTQTSRKFKVTGNSTFDGGVVFTGTLEGSGFSVSGGNVIMPAFIAHDGDSNTKFGFAAADRFTVETAGNERLRIDENGKIIVATGTLHSTRVLARFGIDCHGMNIFDGVGVVANYGMAFYNDPNTNYANGIGFFNDDGQTCGGYIVHQDKGGSNVGDIIMATAATANAPVERLTISSLGNIKQNLSSPSGTSPYQNTHWYDREGGHYTLTAIDDNYLSATKNDSNNGYNDVIYKRVRMSKNCDIEFELSGNSPAGTYRHVGFVINGDGTGTHSNWDRLVFRSRPGNTTSNQIRIDKGNGSYGFNETGSYIPTFFDGTERHILIQLRDRLVNVIVDGVVIISQKTNADFNRSQGWFGFGIYEGGESAQVYIRNLTIKNKFIQPHWLVRATGVNVDVSNGDALPFNQVIKASSDINNTSHYNNSSYRFNVPISGMYYCFVRAYRNSSTGSEVAFYVNGSVRNRFKPQPNGGDYIFAGSCLIQLMKGEYIDVRAYSTTFDNFYGNSSQSFSSWGGHLID